MMSSEASRLERGPTVESVAQEADRRAAVKNPPIGPSRPEGPSGAGARKSVPDSAPPPLFRAAFHVPSRRSDPYPQPLIPQPAAMAHDRETNWLDRMNCGGPTVQSGSLKARYSPE
jgi:hypothetical protein